MSVAVGVPEYVCVCVVMSRSGKDELTENRQHEGKHEPSPSPRCDVLWCVWQSRLMQERAGCWYLVIGCCLVNGWVQLGVGVWVRGVYVSVCVCVVVG